MKTNTVDAKWGTMAVYCLATAIGWLALLPPVALLLIRGATALVDLAALCGETAGMDMHNGDAAIRVASAFWFAGLRTVAVASVAVAVAMLFALPASFILAKTDSIMGGSIRFAILALAGIPIYVTVSGVIRIFSLAWLIDPLSPGKTLLATGLINGMGHAPLAAIVASAAWLSIPRENEEAGLLLAGPAMVWRKISLPLGAGGLAAAGALVGVLSACDMTVPDALTVRTWAEELYLAFNLELDPGKAAISALPLAFIAMAGMGALLWRSGKMSARILSNQGRASYRYRLGRFRIPTVIILAAAALVMLWPALDLLWTGMSESRGTLAWTEVRRAALNTIACSGMGSGLAVFLAFPLAWTATRRRSRLFRIGLAAASLFFLSLPTPLYGYAIASFWNQPWWNAPGLSWVPRILYDSPLATVSLYAMQTLPLAILMLWASFKQIPVSCLDAADTLSIPSFSVITRIVLPLSRKGCLLTWAVCYLLTLRELGGLLLIAPPGWTFLAVRYATRIHFGVYADLAFLLAASLPLVLLPPLALAYRAFRPTRLERGISE